MLAREQERPSQQGGARAGSERRVFRQLGGSLAHHVNNALMGVIGHLELALPHAASGSPLERHLRSSLECASQAAETVRQVVRFTGSGVGAEEPSVFPLRQLAEEVLGRFRLFSSPAQLRLVPGYPGMCRGSFALLVQAVESVVRNALEASSPGGVVTLEVGERDGQCWLRISDSGPGLSAEACVHLFEPFWTSKGGRHLGLGLVMAREVVEAQGGTLEIDSLPGHGVTASFRLPASSPAERRSAVPAPHSAALVQMLTVG